MERIKEPLCHEWHVAINKHSEKKREFGDDHPGFMYEAKRAAEELPRMALLFKRDRENALPKTHQQCSSQGPVPVDSNCLKCCLGIKTKECSHLIALEKIERCTPDDIDTAKAWTCAAHILSNGGDVMREGYLLTVGDRMYWDSVYESLTSEQFLGDE